MRQMEVILTLCVLWLIVGCTKDFTFEEVVGRYQTRAYPSLDLAVVTLNPDSTYEQVFIYENRDVLRNTGKWTFGYSEEYGTEVTLRDAIRMRVGRDSRTVYPESLDVYDLNLKSDLLSDGIFFEVDPDFGITYYKVETEDDDD